MARRQRTTISWDEALLNAARRDDPDALQRALDAGANINAQGVLNTGTALHRAGPETTPLLLKAGADVHATDAGGDTPLHSAADRTEPEIIDLLLKAGADPNATNKRGQTPLHLCLLIEVAQPLLDGGARVHADYEGRTPVDYSRRMDPALADLIESYEQRAVASENRSALGDIAQDARPQDDLADPEEIRAMQSQARRM